MDRALDLDILALALGEHVGEERDVDGINLSRLPTVTELQDLLSRAEAELFLNQRQIPEQLVLAGWYLHGVASASNASELYSVERQRRAFAVSAHICDLASLRPGLSPPDLLRLVFAAQVGYLRSELEPNAVAMGRRVAGTIAPEVAIVQRAPLLGMEAGCALLTFDLQRLPAQLRGWRTQLRSLQELLEVDALEDTIFGPPASVVLGASALVRFLRDGDRDALGEARRRFDLAVNASAGDGDRDNRWVASHLRTIADDASDGSVWSVLPPDVPRGAKQAFTLTAPAIAMLWQPQRELLRPSTDSADAPDVFTAKRLVLSVPTSAGKTLLSQLLMIAHLAQHSSGVCYVAPQRSLGREVRRALARRLRILAREMALEEPDFGVIAGTPLAALLSDLGITELVSLLSDDVDLVVATPERLAHALREDASAVLNRFGMFVFDEAHLIREQGRGLVLESVMSYLHWRTSTSPHKILVLSAAMGNAGQVVQWMGVDGATKLYESAWRGPRRLHAVFTSEYDSDQVTETEVRASGASRHLTKRLTHPMFGVVRLRPAEGQAMRVRTIEPIGHISFRATADGRREGSPERDHTTPFYQLLAHIVRYVSHAGPVLIIRNTRRDSASMARAIANGLPAHSGARGLAEFARIRLGAEHPLSRVLLKGVAYHHAGLPVDILDAIEEGIRTESLRFVAATTTLTEGVNLPVRTVVLAADPFPGQDPEQAMSGPRLVNAIGRAGRAAKECEGWVLLARQAREAAADFNVLTPGSTDLWITSRLTSESALESLAAFEDAVRASQDAVTAAGVECGDFITYIWFVCASEEALGRAAQDADVVSAFRSTLAYQQLDPASRARWESVALRTRTVYAATDPVRRRWWARTGTSVASARRIDELASAVTDRVATLTQPERAALRSARSAIGLLNDVGAFGELLDLRECPAEWDFRVSLNRPRSISIDPARLIQLWVAGVPLPEVADTLLEQVADRAYRLEQLVDAVANYCEHYFAWMTRALLDLVSRRFDPDESPLCADLPMFMRYGVDNEIAVALLLGGVRSRDFAMRVASIADGEGIVAADLRRWLGGMSLTTWTSRLAPAPSDVYDLLEFTRKRRSGVLRALLAEGAAEVVVSLSTTEAATTVGLAVRVEIDRSSDRGSGPTPFVVLQPQPDGADKVVAEVPTPSHADMQSVIDAGVLVEYELNGETLRLRLRDDE